MECLYLVVFVVYKNIGNVYVEKYFDWVVVVKMVMWELFVGFGKMIVGNFVSVVKEGCLDFW